MRYEPFEMERWQSTHEHRVRYNLSESGVHPLTVEELLELAGTDIDSVAGVRLGYGQSNGSDELRERIAALYPGASAENVLVTTGSAEANFTAFWHLLDPSSSVATVLPNYMQVPGLLTNFGARVVPFHLEEAEAWQPNLDELADALEGGARVILITNPSNPTGSVIDEARTDRLVELADRYGAWIVADEVYQGAEVDGEQTPSLWGRCDRVLVTNSLSKAYGLPGLRLGWIVGPEGLMEDLWGRTDYTTIAPASLSDALATLALQPTVRSKILNRTRGVLQQNLGLLRSWLDSSAAEFTYHAPRAGAICYVRYASDINSSRLAERLRLEKSLLVVPGDHFGMDGYMRLGFGPPADELAEALALLSETFAEFATRSHT